MQVIKNGAKNCGRQHWLLISHKLRKKKISKKYYVGILKNQSRFTIIYNIYFGVFYSIL